jgi:predicted phage terminase large subunit-like protein
MSEYGFLSGAVQIVTSPVGPKWATPGDLADVLDRRNVRTPALDLIDEALVEAYNTPNSRLIISMPPQEGKSTRVGVMFPLWVLGQDKSKAIVMTSYSDRLVRKNSKNVRNYITTDGHRMGLSLARDSRSATQWKLAKERGGMYAVSIGGSLTGEPADLLIIDDPHKGAKEADSANQREDVWEWWLSTASARLGAGASVVLILTRWHEDDLAGRFLGAEDGHVWKYLNIPAQADHNPDAGAVDILGRVPGEFMASAQGRTTAEWEATKVRQTARNWNAMFQGRPSAASGNILHREHWQFYDAPLWTGDDHGRNVCTGDGDTLIQSWDMTFKSTQASDYVVGQVWLKRGPNAYLLDQVRRRMTFTESVKAVEAVSAKWPQTNTKLIEDKANGTAVLDVLRARMPGLTPINPKESKEARASAVAWAIEAHNVYLPAVAIAPWVDDLVEEAASFPNGAHDDQVDALTQALNRLMVNTGDGAAWLEYLKRRAEPQPTETGGPQNAITSRVGPGNRPVRSERPIGYHNLH